MQYFLNGGRNERDVLSHPSALELYKKLAVSRLLIIPYAIVEDEWQRYWYEAGDLFQTPGLDIKSLSTYDSDPKIIEERIGWADFIYLTGGAQKTLLRRLKELGTEEMILDAMTSGNLKLIGGGSAGAMVMGSRCIIGHKAVNEVVSGLGILSETIIDSHFTERNREDRLMPILKTSAPLKGIGIDENTGLHLDQNFQVEQVFGAGSVSIYQDNKKVVYDSPN